jgi:hypothetical protein
MVRAATLILLLAPLPALAATKWKPHVVTGGELLTQCQRNGAQFCSGMVWTIRKSNGDRFLTQPCMPAIELDQPGTASYAKEIVDYLIAHPESRSRPATDVAFEVERRYLLTTNECKAYRFKH